MKVFFSGSKRISEPGVTVLGILDGLMRSGEEILIGDCPGADQAIQHYLSKSGYPLVTVYCSGDEPRFNAGDWDVRTVELDPSLTHGFQFWRQKDIQMELECDCAVAVWDGESRGTRQNILELSAMGKECRVVLQDGEGTWLFGDIGRLLGSGSVRIRLQGEEPVQDGAVPCPDGAEAPEFLSKEEKAVELCAGFEDDSAVKDLMLRVGFDYEYWKQERREEPVNMDSDDREVMQFI